MRQQKFPFLQININTNKLLATRLTNPNTIHWRCHPSPPLPTPFLTLLVHIPILLCIVSDTLCAFLQTPLTFKNRRKLCLHSHHTELNHISINLVSLFRHHFLAKSKQCLNFGTIQTPISGSSFAAAILARLVNVASLRQTCSQQPWFEKSGILCFYPKSRAKIVQHIGNE